jgi:carboxymethylenebutenolidase
MFGEKDNLKGFSDPTARQSLIQHLTNDGKKFQVQLYPEASHAFMNEQRPEVYREKDSKDAFEKSVAFFQQNLA